MRILTVVGARPQLVKASVVSRALARAGLAEDLVHTGQHFDANMSDVFFRELDMRAPFRHLGVHGGSHAEMTGRMLLALEPVFEEARPDLLLVYGDTNSTLAGALVAVKRSVPIAHVEAGVRSFNRTMPEEINRILVDRVATLLFAPTETAVRNLRAEGAPASSIQLVGDVMFDVALAAGRRPSAPDSIVRRLGLTRGGFTLATVHRAENTDDPHRLAVVVDAFRAFAAESPVVWPLHPRTRQRIEATGALAALRDSGVTLIDPVGYLDMVELERDAALVATDSGGVQKEAFFFGVPCVTLRDETEWVELVEAGWNRLAPPTDVAAVVAALRASLGVRGREVRPYGDGDAAERIVAGLRDVF